MPSFFIDRPIFAWVVALFICLVGAISIPLLAVAQYPIIAPPSISISTSYPGASPENLYNSVARQPVRTGAVQDGQWLVTDGLKAGDRVVVEGFQKFAAGDKVKPQSWDEADASADTTASSQSASVQR